MLTAISQVFSEVLKCSLIILYVDQFLKIQLRMNCCQSFALIPTITHFQLEYLEGPLRYNQAKAVSCPFVTFNCLHTRLILLKRQK